MQQPSPAAAAEHFLWRGGGGGSAVRISGAGAGRSHPLRSLYAGVADSDWAARQHALRAFLEAYASACAGAHPSSVPFRFPGARSLSRELLWWVVRALCGCGGDAAAMLQRLSSRDGALALWALDLALTSSSRAVRGCADAAVALTRVAEALLALPPHATAAAIAATRASQQPLPPALAAAFCDVGAGLSAPVPSLLAPRRLPQVFSALADPQQTGEGSSQQSPAAAAASTFVGCVCTRLLSVVGRLFLDPATVKAALSREGSVDPLLRVLALDYSRSDCGLYTVHRQAIRTLGALLATASQEVGSIVILAQRGVVEFLVSILKANLLAGSILLELVQLLVRALQSTSHLCSGLVDAFRQCGGYDALLNAFLFAEKHGSRHERLLWVHTLCQLLFVVPSPSIAINAMSAAEKTSYGTLSRDDTEDLLCLQNQDGIKLLLSAFVQVSDEELKTELLKAVQAVFVVQMNKFSIPSETSARSTANPFTALFVQFDDLSGANKARILAMLDEVVVLGNLSLVESRAYCALLQGKRPSTILMICKHMSTALAKGTMTRVQLHEAGLLSILSTYLVPPSELSCASALVDPEERSATLALVTAEQHSGCNQERLSDEEGDGQVQELLAHISRSVLRLLCVFLENNEKSQLALKDSPKFRALFGLLFVHELRAEALEVVTIMANSFPKLEHRIIQSLIAVLQSSGGTSVDDPDVIAMWTHVLNSLLSVLKRSKEAAFAFKAGGGFAWALSVIDGFSRARCEEASERPSCKELAHRFLLTVLHVLAAALKGCPENVQYLRSEIGFRTFAGAMKSCLRVCLSEAEQIVQTLVSLAIRGVWPLPPCAHEHPLQPSSLCAECNESLAVTVTDVLAILVTDVLEVLLAAKDERCALYAIDSVLQVANASQCNVQALCSFDLSQQILQHFGGELFSKLSSGDPVATKLADLIVCLCSSNITSPQLRLVLTTLAGSGFSPSVMQLLQRISDRPATPPISVALRRWSETVGLNGKWLTAERHWPPRKFTASLWLCVDSYGRISQQPLVHPFFSFNSSNRACQLAASLCQGTLTFQLVSAPRAFDTPVAGSSSASSSAAAAAAAARLPMHISFSEVSFEQGLWYHVLLSYEAAQEKRKGSSSLPTRCFLALFVNGGLRAQAVVGLPHAVTSHVSLNLGAEAIPSETTAQSLDPDSAAGFRVGNAFFFEETATPQDAFLLYTLGPSFNGSLAGVDFAHYCHCLDPNVCFPTETTQRTLLSPEACSLKHLSDRTICVFVAHRMSVVETDPLCNEQQMTQLFVAPAQQMSASSSSLPIPAPPPVCHVFTRDIRDTINDVGGVPLVLYLMGIANTKEQQIGSFRFLASLLRGSSRNTRQMEALHGYQVAARIMKRAEWVLDTDTLDLAFLLVGVSRSSIGSSFDSGIIADASALRHIILNWYIWSRAPLSVQKQLVEGLFSLVSLSNSSAFNVKRLSQCGAVEELLFFLQRSETPEELLPPIITLIKAIVDDTQVSRNDMRAITDFLFATHTLPICFTYSIGTPRRAVTRNRSLDDSREIVLRSRSAQLLDSLRREAAPAAAAAAAASPLQEVSGGEDDLPPARPLERSETEVLDPSSPRVRYSRNEESEAITRKRALVLEMLLDILSKAPRTTQAELSEVFPVEGMLSMMQHSALAIRVPLLLLLDLCLQASAPLATAAAAAAAAASSSSSSSSAASSVASSPAVSAQQTTTSAQQAAAQSGFAKFLRIGGFALLGTQLQSYSASSELFHALFRLLIGPSFPRSSATDLHVTVHGAWEQATSKGQVELARPEVIRTILMVASGPMAELPEQHSVVKSLHHICASSPMAAQSMLENGILGGLFDVLATRIDRRRAKMALGPPPPPPPSLLDGQQRSLPRLEDDGDGDTTDEDIMSLLASIALHPCRKFSCDKILSDMLLLVRSTGFQTGISEALQSRLLYDVFGFFSDNPRFVRDASLVLNLNQILGVAIEYIRWKMVPGSASGHNLPTGATLRQQSAASLDAPSLKARKEVASLLHVTKISAARAVIRILKLLVSVLGSINDPFSRDALSKSYWSLMDNAWRLLSFVLRKPKRSTLLIDTALDALMSKALLTEPVEHRCCALMISVSQFLGSEDLSIRAKASKALELLRKQTKRPTLLSVVTSTLSTPLMFRMSTPAPVVDTTERLQQRLGRQPPMELRSLAASIVDEAFRWEDDENALSLEFQQSQNKLYMEQKTEQNALRKAIREHRIAVTQTVTSLQWRAQTKPMEERSEKIQEDLAVTTTSWKSFFDRLTHERAVFAIRMHAPYRRLKLDPTQNTQRQRLRLRWTICKPVSPTLNSPYTSIALTGSSTPAMLLPVEMTAQKYSYRLLDGNCTREAAPELPVDSLPLITNLSPTMEEGTKGGCLITVTGRFFPTEAEKQRTLWFLFGGIRADIVEVSSDTQVIIRSPPQPAYGTYEVNVVFEGQLRRGVSARYGYYELSKFAEYIKTKNLMTLSHDEESVLPLLDLDAPLVARSGFASTPQQSEALSAVPRLPIQTSSATAQKLTPRAQGLSFASGYMIRREAVKLSSRCTWVTAFAERDGDLLLTDRGIQFFVAKTPDAAQTATRTLTWLYDDISEIHRRRYVLQDLALELFFVNGKTCFLAFSDSAMRDRALKEIRATPLPNLHDFDTEEDLRSGIMSSSLTDRWVRGQISNFEYLMRINILAGRTFNDLNQYPVFPWVVADYTSPELDLSNPKTFRDLSKPMGAQDPVRVRRFMEKYEQLLEMGEVPYHYGTHYSNGAIVTHYLSRLEPFAAFHVAFQSGKFDVPDRLFFDTSATWALASCSPLGDVKELTPEFFSLPEILENPNSFDFGERQDASRVFAVELPPWAHGSPREFVRLNREALESEFVSQHLHEWIDLVFGFKQQDKEALNVFHPFTCQGGIDWDAIRDPLDRIAKRTQVNTWGQTPRQIFKRPHPRRGARASQLAKLGPAFGGMRPVESFALFTIASAVGSITVTADNVPVAIGPGKESILASEHRGECLSWGHWDNSVRISLLDTGKTVVSAETVDVTDSVTCASLSPSGACFVCGTNLGVVFVWKRPDPGKSVLASPSSQLFGHSAAVRAVFVSSEFSVIATGSDDATCILWDSNRLMFLHSLAHGAAVTAVCISDVDGSVYTLEQTKPSCTDLHVWSINGDHLAGVSCGKTANCVRVTASALGVRPNVVATGNEDGTISLWNAATLESLGILTGVHSAGITALAFSGDSQHLFSGDSRGQVAEWDTLVDEEQK